MLLNRVAPLAALIQSLGFIVPRDMLDKAISAIEAAGRPRCPCEDPLHAADPGSVLSVPVHFCVPSTAGVDILYLCPHDIFLDLIPLSPSHPNPAGLEWLTFDVNFRHPDPNTVGNPEDMHVLRVLMGSSLTKVLLLLSALSPETRGGVIFSWEFTLLQLRHMVKTWGNTGSGILEEYWDITFDAMTGKPVDRKPAMERVKAEWRERLLV